MKPESLIAIKKELKALEREELIEICLKVAKYKKENKELIHYLVFESSDVDGYIDSVKKSLQAGFESLHPGIYLRSKEIRKILRTLNKHIKFTGQPLAEVQLLIWFSQQFLRYAGLTSSQKQLALLLFRVLQRIKKNLLKLHEDLLFDYREEYETLLEQSSPKLKNFDLASLGL